MGMDVYGKNPLTDEGEYFRNNVWYWRPLWDYCLEMHGDIAGKVEYGHYNDGDGLDSDDALLLGERLLEDVRSGVARAYETRYNARIAAIPMETCRYCDGTGVRSDAVGVDMGMPTRELEADVASIVGRSHGWCNACRGYGKVESVEASYPFTVENVEEFGNFLVACGGFSIC